MGRLLDATDPELPPGPVGVIVDRRGDGFAGVVGELITTGEPVLVGVADVARRRDSLETLVAGLADDGLAVVSWDALAADPALAGGFAHLAALDPPPGGSEDPLLALAGHAHLAWGAADVDFALAVWRHGLQLRPALADCFRELRELDDSAEPDALERALRGRGRHPRPAELCARLISVLRELGLVELTLDPPACRVVEGTRTELELSPTYRSCLERYAEIEARLGGERQAPARPAAVA
jgi:single-stranded-DNA-specific exonuclease